MSKSQSARVVTELWVKEHGYCLSCDSDQLCPTTANTPARDFICETCFHPYELKASAKPFGARVVDGSYRAMMDCIRNRATPSLLLMQYSANWSPQNLTAVHRSMLLPAMIEQRQPLSASARRAGWVGCNILLSRIPPEARIPLIHHGMMVSRNEARDKFRRADRFGALSIKERSWAANVLACLQRFGHEEFDTKQVYSLVDELQGRFPKNQHVREKLRQQLQVLRDLGMLSFERRGVYRLTQHDVISE